MSASATPNDLTRATTAVIRRAASPVASARVAAFESTPSVSSAVPGAALAQALGPVHAAAIYASPLVRARESAAPIAAHQGIEVTLESDFREMCFGDWEGLTRDEVERRFPEDYKVWLTTPERFARPGSE